MSLFLPGKFHGQRCLVNYSSGGHKKLDTTEHTHINTHNVFLTLNKPASVSISFMNSSLNFLKP